LAIRSRATRQVAMTVGKTGAPIVARDEHGTIVAASTLETGTSTRVPSDIVGQAQFDCTFTFSLGAIAGDPTFYGITIGTGSPITFSRAQVVAASWNIKIDATP